jgi:hypothetical protein
MTTNNHHLDTYFTNLGEGNTKTHFYNHSRTQDLGNSSRENSTGAISKGFTDLNSATHTSLRTERFSTMGSNQ